MAHGKRALERSEPPHKRTAIDFEMMIRSHYGGGQILSVTAYGHFALTDPTYIRSTCAKSC